MCAIIEKESLYQENKQNNRIKNMRIIAFGKQKNDKTVTLICLLESIVYKQLA